MPKSKTTTWLEEDYEDKKEKAPTLRQYLKELPKDAKDIKSTVRLIWLPGRWENYTLQTDDFRVIVSRGHKLFNSLRDNLDAFTKGTETLDVIVTDRAKISFRLSVNDEERGEWFFVGGDAGLKFEVDKTHDPTESGTPF